MLVCQWGSCRHVGFLWDSLDLAGDAVHGAFRGRVYAPLAAPVARGPLCGVEHVVHLVLQLLAPGLAQVLRGQLRGQLL